MSNFANFFSKSVSIIVGLMFLIIGSIFFFKYDPDAYDVPAIGTITDIEEHYESIGEDNELVHTVYIDYTADGTKYEHVEFPGYNSGMKIGDTVDFFYMSEDPTQIAGTDKGSTPYFGLAAAVVGLIILIVTVVKIIKRKPM